MDRFVLSGKLKNTLLAFIGVGAVSLAAGFFFQPHRAWAGLLVLAYYLLIVALSGGFFTSLQFIAGAKWSVVIRRLTESMVVLVPVAAIFIGIVIYGIFYGVHHLYEWSNAEAVANDHLLHYKEPYLNPVSFTIRLSVYLVVWFILGTIIKKMSIRQDETRDPETRKKLVGVSTAYMLFFVYTFALGSIDLVMSLEPHWYTTMFPVYCFANLAYTGFGVMILLTYNITQNGGLKNVNKEHFHDLGKFQLMFIIFWGYIAFSQHMLTWYANLPEETIYLERRLANYDWGIFTAILWLGHFVIPFFIMLSRKLKRTPGRLQKVAWWTTFMGFVDVVWMVYGGLQKEHIHGFPFSWMEAGLYLGAVGIIGFVVLYAFSKVNQEPVGDPYYKESLNFHQPH